MPFQRSGNTSVVDLGVAGAAFLGEPPPQRFTVPAVTIDALTARLGGPVEPFKLDVEGAEPQVIAGAAATIRVNPQIAMAMAGQFAAAGTDPRDFALWPGTVVRDAPCEPLSADALADLPYLPAVVLRPGRQEKGDPSCEGPPFLSPGRHGSESQ